MNLIERMIFKMIRKIIQIDEEKCNGCGACANACHEGAIGMMNGKAKLLQAAVFYLLDRRFAVFDEMDSALSSSDFIKAVRAYLDKGIALLVITHDLGVASALPGRKLMIEEGVLCEYK